jgi:hypothetical protein
VPLARYARRFRHWAYAHDLVGLDLSHLLREGLPA